MIQVSIGLPKASVVVLINQLVCEAEGNPHQVLDMERIVIILPSFLTG
jgi:hypothetical protein